MKYPEEKKNSIILYLLEKIRQEEPSLSKKAAENFAVNQSTIHEYLKELVAQNVIFRVSRGKYQLVEHHFQYKLSRKKGDLENDIQPYYVCLEEHLNGCPENIKHIWSYVFSEMINNIMDHSEAEHAEVMVVSNALDTTVVLSDDGIGIFKKIREHFKLSTAQDAVSELLKGKLTTDSKNHSGEGIFFSSRMMDVFVIVSEGTIYSINKYDDDLLTYSLGTKKNGTTIIMRLSNYSKKKPTDIFNQYASIDGGFTKTKLPLKNIFDDAPVSRSQAKRICNRLEKFEEVVLDFEGIPWMGQGFAHQIFSVFAREHPNIKLIPENMNPEVEEMYLHVK